MMEMKRRRWKKRKKKGQLINYMHAQKCCHFFNILANSLFFNINNNKKPQRLKADGQTIDSQHTCFNYTSLPHRLFIWIQSILTFIHTIKKKILKCWHWNYHKYSSLYGRFYFSSCFLSHYSFDIFKLFFSTDIKYSNGFILIFCFQLCNLQNQRKL